MPYKIFPEGGKFCVYKHDTSGNKVGSSHGCHPSRKNAIEQLRALYAAEPGVKEMIILDEKARSDLKPGDFLVPDERRLPITKTPGGEPDHGICGAAWAALHEGFRGNKYEGPNKASALERLKFIYKRMGWPLPSGNEKECTACYGPLPSVADACPSCGLPANLDLVRGVKAFEQDGERYLVLWTSNAFQDREKETFETQAWKDYVERRDSRPDGRRYDRVWFWHVKGTDFADILWEDMVGRVLVDVARLDHTEFADKMYHAITHPEEFPDIAPLGWGTSQGFAYRLGDKQNGVYSFVEKFESTVLPYHRASNLWGGIKEVVDMAVTKEKKDALSKLVGQALADATLADAEKATSVLEQAGISFKEDSETEEQLEQAAANDNPEEYQDDEAEETEEQAEDEEQLYELEVTDELVKEIAAHVDIATGVKEAVDIQINGLKEAVGIQINGLKEAIIAELKPVLVEAINAAIDARTANLQGSKEQIVQQALSGKIKLTPWTASQSDSTKVPDGMVTDAKEAKTGKKKGDVVHDVVSRMLTGQ